MRPRRGLFKDAKPIDQPADTYIHGKNGVWDMNHGAVQNEKGFLVAPATFPYRVIGSIETDGDPIIFSTDNTNSAYGWFRQSTGLYEPIVDDAGKSFKLNFNTDHPIVGEFRRNYKNDPEIAWIELGEDPRNPPRFHTLSEEITEINQLLLFPEALIPEIEVSVVEGGNLGMGAYFVGARYLSSDGTETRYFTVTPPVFATSEDWSTIPGGNTGKALRIDITNVDQRYDQIQLVVVTRINGVTTARQLSPLPVAEEVTFTYSGESGEEITLEETLIPSAFYRNAKAITQLNDILYLADITEAANYNMQKYVNLIKVRWQATLHKVYTPEPELRSGEIKTFKHGEVYALYIVFNLKTGQKTRAFHIPGIYNAAYDTNSSVASNEDFEAKRYQVEDTTQVTTNTPNKKEGIPGMWINQGEVYPDIEDFDSSDIGGENLRGQPVRHHMMPTLGKIGSLFQSTMALDGKTFGIDSLPALGLTLDNVIIPPEYVNDIVGWEIYYAKRDFNNNSTVIDQGMLLLAANKSLDRGLPVCNSSGSVNDFNNFFTTGGNFNSALTRARRNEPHRARMGLTKNVWRFHGFSLMFNKPSINPSFMRLNFRMRKESIDSDNQTRDKYPDGQIRTLLDYDNVSNARVLGNFNIIKGINGAQYLPNDYWIGPIWNNKAEAVYTGWFNNGDPAHNPPTSYNMDRGMDVGNPAPLAFTSQRARAAGGGGCDHRRFEPITFEETYNCEIVTLKDSIYVPYHTQDLVRTGKTLTSDSEEFVYGGDCFLVQHGFITMGVFSQQDADEWFSGSDEVAPSIAPTGGTRVARRYICESSSNIWQRYEDPADPISFWPPNSTDIRQVLADLDRRNEPNKYGYNKDGSSVGDLLNGISVEDPNREYVEFSPYKIIRSSVQNREGQINSWKNFNALDYYITQKNMGRIIQIQGYDNRLIIHHENALFLTEDRTTLEGDILSVTLGTGDIFRMPPREGKSTKLGYAGTQHKLASVLLQPGYLFPDAKFGAWYLFNSDGLIPISELGLDNFTMKYLKMFEDNPYIGNGITVGYDPQYERILITVRNLKATPAEMENFVPGYEPTEEFFDKLTPGVSIVFKDGRYQRFLGENTSSEACDECVPPTLNDYEFTIQELRPAGTLVDTIAAVSETPVSYVILSGNTGGAFQINSQGEIRVANSSQASTANSPFELTVQANNACGEATTSTVTITLTPAPKPPILGDYEVTIPENTPNGEVIETIQASPGNCSGGTLTYGFGIGVGEFQINSSTGEVSVLDNLLIDPETQDTYVIPIQVTCSTTGLTGEGTLTIHVTLANSAPQCFSHTEELDDFPIPTGTLLYQGTPSYDREVEQGRQNLFYSLISNSHPDILSVDVNPGSLEPDPEEPDVMIFVPNPDFLKVTTLEPITGEIPSMEIVIGVMDEGSPTPNLGCQIKYTFTSPMVGNDEMSQTFTRNNCGVDQIGTDVVYTVPANTYFAPTKAEANQLAQDDIDANGQNYANQEGDCLPAATGWRGANLTCERENEAQIEPVNAPDGIYHHAGTDQIYIANWGGDNVLIADGTSLAIIGSIPNIDNARSVVPVGADHVMCIGETGNIAIVNVNSNTVTATGSVPVVYSLGGFAVDAWGGDVAVVGQDNGRIYRINKTTAAGTLVGTVAGGITYGANIPGTANLVVLGNKNARIHVYDIVSHQIKSYVDMPNAGTNRFAVGLNFKVDGGTTYLFALNQLGSTVARYTYASETLTLQQSRTLQLAINRAFYNENDDTLYVSENPNKMYRLNPMTFATFAVIELTGFVRSTFIAADNLRADRIYIGDFGFPLSANPGTRVAVLGPGKRTGYAVWLQLEKYYLATGNLVIPRVTKPNEPGDPDYIPKFQDLDECPLEQPTIPCDGSTSYDGGESFPSEFIVNLGTGTGEVTLTADAFSIPDKFVVFFDGVEVINTGYRGSSAYQDDLNTELSQRGLPTEPIVGPGPVTATFNKTSTNSVALVRVYAPLPGTAWNVTLSCPE